MVEELSQLTTGGLLALLIIREVLLFLKSRRDNGGGGGRAKTRPITGRTNQSVKIDLSDIEKRIDRVCSGLDAVRDAQAHMARSLDDLNHAGDKTRLAVDKIGESISYLEKSERGREQR